MTAEQLRAARKLCGMSVSALALRCCIPKGAVSVFERTGRMSGSDDGVTGADRISMITAALEAAGTEFIGSSGIAIRGTSRSKMGSPALSPASCRAARALLNLSRPALAKAAGIGDHAVKALEEGRLPAGSRHLATLQDVLEASGVVLFADGVDGLGAGARLRAQGE